MKNWDETLGKRLRRIRNLSGFSIHELAERAKITEATLNRVENDEMLELKQDAIDRLAKCLGTSADYLLGRGKDLGAANEEAQH